MLKQTVIFNEFQKWYENHQHSSSTTSIPQTGTSFASLTQSNSLGPWVLDSGSTDHITGNKSFFSSQSTSGYLHFVTMANDSSVSSHGSLFNLLFVNRLTRSLDCVIYFTKDFVCLQEWNSK